MEEYVTPTTESIGIVDYRKLLEVTKAIGRFMSHEEFLSIMKIYLSVADRLEKEGESNETDSSKS